MALYRGRSRVMEWNSLWGDRIYGGIVTIIIGYFLGFHMPTILFLVGFAGVWGMQWYFENYGS
jgi:hypothetical protein